MNIIQAVAKLVELNDPKYRARPCSWAKSGISGVQYRADTQLYLEPSYTGNCHWSPYHKDFALDWEVLTVDKINSNWKAQGGA